MMSLAQGLCSNLMEYAWKSHIKLLYPTPAQFTSFLGDVSTWQVRQATKIALLLLLCT